MKKLLLLSSLFVLTFGFGQQISDYQYIYVPQKFNDTETNRFGLNELIQLKLKQKNYAVITGNSETWPVGLSQNPCRMLTAEVVNSSNMFKNKVDLVFTDCQNKKILTLDGKSSIKDFEPGMREALEDAAKKLPVSNPVETQLAISPEEPKKVMQEVENMMKGIAVAPEVKTVQIVPAAKTEASAGNKAEVYSNGSLNLNKILLTKGEFILFNPNDSSPYATFKPSTKKEVYHVQLSDGMSTIGYTELGNIIVDIKNSDGSFRKEIFNRK